MKKLTKREKLIYSTLILMLIVVLLLGIVTDIYAKYTSTISGSGSIDIAKWEFKVNDKKETQTFDITFTTDGNETKIFPTSTGNIQIKVENNSNVQAKAILSLREIFANTNIDTDTIKIYKNMDFSEEIDITSKNLEINIDSESSDIIKLYWKWTPNTDASIDQAIAENYTGFTLLVDVKGEQIIGETADYTLKIVDKT